MMRRQLLLIRTPLLFAAVILMGAGPVGAAARAPKIFTVVIDKMKFGPAPAAVRVGDTIRWVNKDIFKHSATARDRSFNIVLAPGQSGKTVIRRAGSIAFYCAFHPGMKGVLSVAR